MKNVRIIEDNGIGVLAEGLAKKKGDVNENENRKETELRTGEPSSRTGE